MSGSARRSTRRTRPEPVVAVVSPYADEDDARVSPTATERLRGLLGMSALIVISGVALAVLVAVVLLALAVFVATTFN